VENTMMIKDNPKNRRKDIRVDFDTFVSVTANGKTFQAKGSSRDLSLRSVFVKTENPLAPETSCQVEIVLTGLEKELVLNMDGHVVRQTSDGYAIYFDMVDLDSYTHLKNIVKYNAPDADEFM
jgi:hypothetical protein